MLPQRAAAAWRPFGADARAALEAIDGVTIAFGPPHIACSELFQRRAIVCGRLNVVIFRGSRVRAW